MKVNVITPFRDKDNYSKLYNVGDVVEFDSARAANLVKRGLVEIVKPEKKLFAEEQSVEEPEPSEQTTTRKYGKRNKE